MIFFIDALGWELIKAHKFLGDLLPYMFRLRTVLGYSCAAQPTIFTGEMPDKHHHWAMYYRTTKKSSFAWLKLFQFLPHIIKNHPRFRRQLLKMHRKFSGITGYYNLYNIPFKYFPFFDICEKRDIYAPGGIENCVTIFDLMAQSGKRYRVWTWRTPMPQAFTELQASLAEPECYDLLFLYTDWLDGFLHLNRTNSDRVQFGIRTLAQKITDVLTVAQSKHNNIKVIVFSDHGMTPVTQTIDLWRAIRELPLIEGKDYLPFYDSTMCRFWFFTPEAREQITSFLRQQRCGRVLEEEELRQEGIFFPDRRFG
ncbi:MAG: alkaline phosphatase family protein [Candidatus Sumerlaeia bacterium]|nr:alkaline phosphatase family protein [Candidatus Sumerlaeia bacterium]